MKNFLMAASAGAALAASVGAAQANVLLYSFETGDSPNAMDGFVKNNATPSQSTSGVTAGLNSLQIAGTPANFSSTYTASIPAVFVDPAVTAVSLDVGVPLGTVYSGTNAPYIGITLYVYNAATSDAEQFQVDTSDERPIPFSMPGTTTNVTIPLTGSDPVSGTDETYAQLLATGFVPTGFQFFLDKNAPLTITVDNVQAVGISSSPAPEPASLGLLGLAGGLFLKRRSR